MIDMFFRAPGEDLAGFCGALNLKNSFFEFAPLPGALGALNERSDRRLRWSRILI
jgi:hypothetical protein